MAVAEFAPASDSTATWSRASDFRALGAAMVVGGVGWAQFGDPEIVLCPLRAVTGVPCPFCGMSTSTLAAARGDIVGSVAANPAGPILLAAVALAWVPGLVGRLRMRGVLARWGPRTAFMPWAALPMLWLWQLARYDLI